MKFLILGATGFVGNSLLIYLKGIGQVDITAVVHSTKPDKYYDGVNYITAALEDISYELLHKGSYDYIFHLARIPGNRFGNLGRRLAGYKGANANKRLLRIINTLPIKPKIIYLSGSLMYGHNPGHIKDEKDDLRPAGFARYYFHAEKPLLGAINNGSQQVMMLRAPWIIGEGSWFKQLYTQYITKNHTVPVYGNANRKMSLITVEDCAAMLYHYAFNASFGKVYNIYGWQDIVYSDFINLISAAYGCTEKKQYTESDMLSVMDKTTVSSICCEIVLGTIHKDVLDKYNYIDNDLGGYINKLVNGH